MLTLALWIASGTGMDGVAAKLHKDVALELKRALKKLRVLLLMVA
jgi:hypothetical protein